MALRTCAQTKSPKKTLELVMAQLSVTVCGIQITAMKTLWPQRESASAKSRFIETMFNILEWLAFPTRPQRVEKEL